MLRMLKALPALVPAFLLGLASCTADPSLLGEMDLAEGEAAIVAPTSALYGTFRSTTAQPGALVALTLLKDGTYHRGQMVACFTLPCEPPMDDGYFSIWRRDGRDYMTLFSDAGGQDRYQYALSGDTMRIRLLGGSMWMSLTRTVDASWCGEPADCTLQNLPVGPCAGGWYCGYNVCSYSCWPPPELE